DAGRRTKPPAHRLKARERREHEHRDVRDRAPQAARRARVETVQRADDAERRQEQEEGEIALDAVRHRQCPQSSTMPCIASMSAAVRYERWPPKVSRT